MGLSVLSNRRRIPDPLPKHRAVLEHHGAVPEGLIPDSAMGMWQCCFSLLFSPEVPRFLTTCCTVLHKLTDVNANPQIVQHPLILKLCFYD